MLTSSFTITPEVSFRACKWDKAEVAQGKGRFQEVLGELQAPFLPLAAARPCARPLPATRNPGLRAVGRELLGVKFRLNWWSSTLGLCSWRPGPPRERLLLTDKMPEFLASGREYNPGPEMRLDCSEFLYNKVLLKCKRDRESFWQRHQKGTERVPPSPAR